MVISHLFFEKLKESQIEIKQKRKFKSKEEFVTDSQSLNPSTIKIIQPASDIIQSQNLNLQLIYSEKSKTISIIDFTIGKIMSIEVEEPLHDLQFSPDQKYIFAISSVHRNRITRFDLKTYERETIQLKKEYFIQRISPNTDASHVVIQTKKKTYLVDWNHPTKKQRIFIQLNEKLMQFIDHENLVLRWQDAVYIYNINTHTAKLLFKSTSNEKIQVTEDLRYITSFNIYNKRYRIFDLKLNDFVHDEKLEYQLQFHTNPRRIENFTYLQTEREFSIFNNLTGMHMYTLTFESKLQSWIFNEKTWEFIFFTTDPNNKNKQQIKTINLKNSTTDDFYIDLPEVRTAFYLTDEILLVHDDQWIYFINLKSRILLYSIVKANPNTRVYSQNYSHVFYELDAATKLLFIRHLFGEK